MRTICLFLLTLLVYPNIAQAQDYKKPVLDAETRLAWHQQHLKMRDESEFKKPRWQHIGPLLMSGRVTDIAKPLDQPFTFYVATASGGVWKTTNEGTNWEAMFDDAPSASVGAITVDPQNSETVWVGFGESNIFRSSMSGTGVYRSDDGGETWNHMGLAETHHIARILVHPKNSDVVYVAACGKEYSTNNERGVYKTTDGGKNWEQVLFESDMAGAYDLCFDPTNPELVYASMWHRIRRPWSDPVPGDGGGIYKTTNGGKDWERLDNGLPKRNECGRIGISVSPDKPETIYALIDSHEVARKAREGERDSYGRPRQDVKRGAVVYRSDDRGESWTKVSEDSRTLARLFSTYGWVFGQIRVDPNDVDTIYVMGVPLLKSTDGGKTFKSLNSRGLHSDHHAMWIDPANSNYIINGNDGGVNISYDGGQTWKDLDNLPVVQFYNVAYDWEEPFNVYGSIQDNNSWMGPHNHNPRRNLKTDWTRIRGGEASYIAIDPENSDLMYTESFYGSIMRTDRYSNQTKQIKPKPADGDPPLRGQWLAPFQLSTHNSAVVYHGMNCLFRSMNRGDDWEQISPDLTYNDPEKQGNISYATISSLSESPVKFGLVYVGTDDGRLHVTKDSGKTWTEILDGLPKTKWVSRVEASAFDEGTVYLTQNGKRDNDFQVYVYRSRDYGQTWEDISEGIPGGPVNVIKEDPKNSNVLYVGTDMGVYVTVDNAKSWHVLGTGLPITFVHDLVVHPRDNVAVIATHGRGMYTLDVESIQKEGEKVRKELEEQAANSNPAKELIAEYDAAYKKFLDAYQNAKPSERREVMKLRPNPDDYSEKLMKLAEENPDTDIEADALVWIAGNVFDMETKEKVLETVFEKYVDHPNLSDLGFTLAYAKPSAKSEERFKQWIAKTPHEESKGAGLYFYGQFLGRIQDSQASVESLESDPRMKEYYGEDGIEFLKSRKVETAEIEKIYEEVLANYPELILAADSPRPINLADEAKSALFEIQNLAVGCIAPDIVGNDLDGIEFKLSDYRGKVVMLDFWGDW